MASNDESFTPTGSLGTGYGKFEAPSPDAIGYTPFEGDMLRDPSINFPTTFYPPAPNIGSLTVPNQQIRTNVTGAPPRKAGPARGTSPKDVVTSFNQMLKAQSQANPDKNYYARIHSYDAGPAGPNFYKRYQAYGQETFDKIGFHPLRNNEAVFTAQTSGWDDFTRMLKHSAWPLFSRGFVSAPKSLFKAFQGDFSADTEDARVYEEAASIGQSSRGGVGAFTSNLFMNFAYTAGIISEAIVEEGGLALLTAATGGGTAPAWMASIANKANQAKNLLKTLSKADNIVDASNILRKSVKAMDNVDDARRMWSAQKVDKAMNSGIGKFFNPIENTANAIMKGVKNEDNLTGLARAYTTGYNTVGGLYRDVRSINMALSEARLEGGMTQNDVYKELYNRYYEKTGMAPSDAEQELMIKQSKDAATTSMMWNTGLIYLSNKVVLDNIVGAGKGITGWTRSKMDDILDLKTGKVIKETEEVVLKSGKKFQKPKYKWEENTFKNKLLNIKKNPVSGTLSFAGTYLKANLMEAAQEVAQEVIGDATKKYYTSTFKNEHLRTQQYAMGLAKSAFTDMFQTSRGWETAASGFFMGMFAGPMNKSVEMLSVGYDKYFNPEQYNEYKRVREDYGKRIVNTLSSVDMNEFFNSRIWNYGVQGSMSDLRLTDSEKVQRDAQDQAFISQMNTVLENDMMNHFVENLEAYKGLTAEEFEEAFPNVPQGEGAKYIGKLDETIDRAKNLEKKYNANKERFPDPISAKDLEGLDPESKEYQNAMLLNEAWKVARYNSIFFSETFENVTKRMSGILDSVASQKLLKNASSNDITVLFDPRLLANQADILRDEIDMMSKTEGAKPKDLLERKQKLDALDNYDKAVNTYLSFTMTKEAIAEKFVNRAKMQGKELSDEELDRLVESEISKRDEKGQVEAAKQLEIAYKDYLRTLAGQTGDYVFDEQIDDSFIKLIDYYKLSDEAKVMNKYTNLLMNPGGFLEQVEQNQKWMSDLYNNRKEYYQEMVKEAMKAKEANDLLNFLASRNIYVSLDDFNRFLETGILPEEFYNDTNNTVIKRSNPEYIELARAFIKFNELNKQVIQAQSADETLRETLKNLDEKMMDEINALEKTEVRNELGPIPMKKKGIRISDILANVEDGQYADLIYMEGKEETQITVYRDGDVLKYNDKEGEEVDPKLKTRFVSGVKYEINMEPDAAEVEAIKEKYKALKELKVEEALAEKENEQFEEEKFVEITPSTPIDDFPAELYNDLYLLFQDYIEKTNIEVQEDELNDRLANFIKTNILAAEVIAEYNKNKKLEIATAPTGEVIVPTIMTKEGEEVSVDELPEEEVRAYLNTFIAEKNVLESKEKLEPEEQNRLYLLKRVVDDLQKYVNNIDKSEFTEKQLATIEVLDQIKEKNKELVRTPNGYIVDDTLHRRVTTVIQNLVSKGYQYTDISKVRIAFNSTIAKKGIKRSSILEFIRKLKSEAPKGFSEYTYKELKEELLSIIKTTALSNKESVLNNLKGKTGKVVFITSSTETYNENYIFKIENGVVTSGRYYSVFYGEYTDRREDKALENPKEKLDKLLSNDNYYLDEYFVENVYFESKQDGKTTKTLLTDLVEAPEATVSKTPTEDIDTKRAEIERRREEELNKEYEGRRAATFSRFNPDGPNQELTKEEHDEIEELIEAAIENGNVTAEQLYGMISAEGYVYTAYGSKASTLAYLKNRLSGKTKTKAGGDLLDETIAKYNKELAALDTTTTEVDAKKADIERRRQEELSNPTKGQLLKDNIESIQNFIGGQDSPFSIGTSGSSSSTIVTVAIGTAATGIKEGTRVTFNEKETREYRTLAKKRNSKIITESEFSNERQKLAREAFNRALSEYEITENLTFLSGEEIDAKYDAELDALKQPSAKQVDRKAAVIEAGLGRELQSVVRARLLAEKVSQEERNKLTSTEEQAIALATEADYKTLLENNKKKLKEETAKFDESQKDSIENKKAAAKKESQNKGGIGSFQSVGMVVTKDQFGKVKSVKGVLQDANTPGAVFSISANSLKEYFDKVDSYYDAELAAFDATTGEFVTDEAITFYENKIKSIEGIINIKPAAKPQLLTKDELRKLVENLVQEKTYEDSRVAGNYVDRAIRDFFAGRTPEFNEKYITKEAYDALFGDPTAVDAQGNRTSVGYLEQAKQRLQEQGLYLYSEGLVLNDSDAAVAGEIDLIMVDREGKVFIVDVKTGDERKWANFNVPNNEFSKKEDYELQQTTYSNLLFNMTGLESLVSLMPIEISKDPETGKILTASAPKATGLLKPDSFRIPLSKQTKPSVTTKTLTDVQKAELKSLGFTDAQIELLKQPEVNKLLDPELRSDVMIEDLKKKYKNADQVLGKTIQERVDTIVPRKGKETSIIQTGRPVSDDTVKKLKRLGFTDQMIGIMSAEDIETAKKIRNKADAKSLIDKYTELLPNEGSEGDQAPPKNAGNANQESKEDIELRQFRNGIRKFISKMDLIALEKYEAETVADLIKNKKISAESAIVASEEIQARKEQLKAGEPSEATPITIEKGAEYVAKDTIFETRNPNNIFASSGDTVRVVSSTENKVVLKNNKNKQKTVSFEEFNKMLILKEDVMQPSTDTKETLTPDESSFVEESNTAAIDLLDNQAKMAELQKEAEDSNIEDLENDFFDSIDEC